MQLQLSIQLRICALGTHYCWVARGNENSSLAKAFTHDRRCGNQTPDPWFQLLYCLATGSMVSI